MVNGQLSIGHLGNNAPIHDSSLTIHDLTLFVRISQD